MNGITDFEKKDYKAAFERYKQEFGDYPGAQDCDKCSYLPTARTIQRNFGGLINLKKSLGLDETDYRTGTRRITVAAEAMSKSYGSVMEAYQMLCGGFEPVQVHRDDFYLDNGLSGARSDFGVYLNITIGAEKIFIDVFYPANTKTMAGCINWKLSKIPEKVAERIYLVCMNPSIEQDIIDSMKSRKINKVRDNIFIISFATFGKMVTDNFCL